MKPSINGLFNLFLNYYFLHFFSMLQLLNGAINSLVLRMRYLPGSYGFDVAINLAGWYETFTLSAFWTDSARNLPTNLIVQNCLLKSIRTCESPGMHKTDKKIFWFEDFSLKRQLLARVHRGSTQRLGMLIKMLGIWGTQESLAENSKII